MSVVMVCVVIVNLLPFYAVDGRGESRKTARVNGIFGTRRLIPAPPESDSGNRKIG